MPAENEICYDEKLPDEKCQVYTTGQVAGILRTSQHYVTKICDEKILKGFKIPGSKTRHFPRSSLVRFMIDYKIPLRFLDDSGSERIYRSGEVAEICRISRKIVHKCFATGELGGYSLPNPNQKNGERRFPRQNIVDFIRKNQGMELRWLEEYD